MEESIVHKPERVDVNVLCIRLEQAVPDGLEAHLEFLAGKVRWVTGSVQALEAFSRRPPEVVLVAAGSQGQGVWFATALLRELDPDLPCLVLVDEDVDLAWVCGMSPGAFVLQYPRQQALLAGHLCQAAEQSRRRRRLQEALQGARNMLERMPSPVLLVEHPDCMVTLSNAMAREFGLREGQHCPAALLPGIFHNPPWERKGSEADGLLRGVGHAGRHWDVHAAWLPNGQLMLTATDVSARVQAEHRLQRSEQRLRALVSNSAVGLYIADLQGCFQMANPALAAMLGYDSPEHLMQEVKSMDEQVYVQPGRRQEMLGALREGRSVRDWVSEVYGRDGDMLWIQESLTPVHDAEGRLCGCEGSVLDITQRRYAEQGYRSALAMLHRTFDSISDLVLLIDMEQRIVLCNTSFARTFSMDKDDVAGAPLGRFLLGSGLGGESRTLRQYLGSDSEYNFLLKNAMHEATYMTSMSPFQDETGAIVGAILIARNVESISSMIDTVVEADA